MRLPFQGRQVCDVGDAAVDDSDADAGALVSHRPDSRSVDRFGGELRAGGDRGGLGPVGADCTVDADVLYVAILRDEGEFGDRYGDLDRVDAVEENRGSSTPHGGELLNFTGGGRRVVLNDDGDN